jgi:hypothetical protein
MTMLSSRERVTLALNHKEADRVPVDLGASPVSGMHVSVVYKLRQALGLDKPGTPVKVVEPYQMLGETKLDLLEALGCDAIGLWGANNMFGFRNEGWKPWSLSDGTPLLVPGAFNTEPEPNGDLYQYAGGDKTFPPAGRMPKGGLFFDSTVRQEPIDDATLKLEDNLQEFGPISSEDLAYFQREAERLYVETDKAILGNFGGTSFGDIALVPGPMLKHPKGIRAVDEWYMSTLSRRDFVWKIFERQCEIGLANLEKIYKAVGNRVTLVMVTGTDFGQQTGSFISPRTYRELYKPFHKQVNDWIHKHTNWKTFNHSCGSVRALLDDFIDAGFDILNPVQCSAASMSPVELKKGYGDRLVFWGGGVDTQRTLPFGTPDEVRREVRDRLTILGPGGGFVFNPIHNVQAGTPIENVLALYESVREQGKYPLDRL